MDFIETSVGSFTVAGLIGLAAATALFQLRRHAWGLMMGLSFATLAALGLGAAALLFTLFKASGQGGDASMNATVILIFGLLGAGIGIVAGFVVGLVQARALGRPAASGILVGLPDAAALCLCVYLGAGFIHRTVEKPVTDASWQAELERRQRRERQKQEIPMPYRELEWGFLQSLDEQRRENRRLGLPEPQPIPRDAENKLRNYWNQTAFPEPAPAIDRSGYQRASEMRKYGLAGLFVGWAAGALALPLARRRQPPTSNEPNPDSEPGS